MKHSVTELLEGINPWITDKDCVDITKLLVAMAEKPATLKKMLDIVTEAYTYETSKV